MVLDKIELAWAAGLFDGEGHIRGKYKTNSYSYAPVLTVTNTDLELLQRFHQALNNLGKVYGPYQRKLPKHKPYWNWRTTSFEHAQATLAMLWSFLGSYKRDRYVKAIQHYKEVLARPKPSRKGTHCKRGHSYAEQGYNRNRGDQVCRICKRAWERIYYWDPANRERILRQKREYASRKRKYVKEQREAGATPW